MENLKLKEFFPSFLVLLFVVAAIAYGFRKSVEHCFVKYGVPSKAIVYDLYSYKGNLIESYEFEIDGELYHGSAVSNNIQIGDTITIWYCPYFPCLNIYVPNE